MLRHALSVALLPGVVTVVVPIWIARRYGVTVSWPGTALGWTSIAVGLVVLAAGFALFAASLRSFATVGHGTLAPWDPPRRLVVRGPYRHVRNPMITGVLFVLAGLALVMRSAPHGVWAGTFLLINAIYIPLVEEPRLAVRFGGDYERYCRHVPRIVPRVRPWRDAPQDARGLDANRGN
jgi:protein-S-isoprenylcysteine O-methyltransferase Ste14